MANGMVRENALELLFSAFPIENPDGPVGERSEIHEKQYRVNIHIMQYEIMICYLSILLVIYVFFDRRMRKCSGGSYSRSFSNHGSFLANNFF